MYRPAATKMQPTQAQIVTTMARGKRDFGPLRVDLDAYEVAFAGRTFTLFLREFQILEVMTSAPLKVWRREEIVQAVWGEPEAVDERTVDVHIRRLRGHLGGRSGAGACIVTVRGVGYKFDPRRISRVQKV